VEKRENRWDLKGHRLSPVDVVNADEVLVPSAVVEWSLVKSSDFNTDN
jgi:hypothetical protein